MDAPIRLGLIGAGHWGRVCLRTLAALPDLVRVTAVASANPATAALMPAGARLFADWRDLLADGLCQGVVIATPPRTHVAIAAAALGQGIAVFVEKPLCLDPAEAVRFGDLALAAGRTVVVDHIHLFNPAFRALVDQARRCGPIVAIRACAGKPQPPHPDNPVLWDWGAHDVAMALALMERRPDRVSARLVDRPRLDGGVGEIVELCLGFDAVEMRALLGSLPERRRSFEVRCATTTLVYDDLAPVKFRRDGAAQPYGEEPPLTLALGEFCRRIKAGCGPDRRELDLAVAVVEVLARAEAAPGA